MKNASGNGISKRTWGVMLALALVGQIAWAVENSWFNTCVSNTIIAFVNFKEDAT